jgi:hypothetical protein
MERREGVQFVAQFLDRETDTAEEAALSLGESRSPEALDILKAQLGNHKSRYLRRALLMGIALTRLREATDFLLSRDVSEAERAELEEFVPRG